jgi:hypothetical protein
MASTLAIYGPLGIVTINSAVGIHVGLRAHGDAALRVAQILTTSITRRVRRFSQAI